jgi:hypothetical protein
VGRHDHFFELGGYSLLAITMLERLRQNGWHAEIRTVFEAPVLAKLAAELVAPTQRRETIFIPDNLIPEEFGTPPAQESIEELRI